MALQESKIKLKAHNYDLPIKGEMYSATWKPDQRDASNHRGDKRKDGLFTF